MEMARELHAENGLFSLNEDCVRETLRKCFNRQGAVVGVIGKSGRLEAATCLMFSCYWYTSDWHLIELFNFVKKPYRKSRNAEALIEFCKSCADKIGIPVLTGIITNKQLASKVRLYRRSLGNPAGAWFLYPATAWAVKQAPTAEDFFKPFETAQDVRRKQKEQEGWRAELHRITNAPSNELTEEERTIRNQYTAVTRELKIISAMRSSNVVLAVQPTNATAVMMQ